MRADRQRDLPEEPDAEPGRGADSECRPWGQGRGCIPHASDHCPSLDPGVGSEHQAWPEALPTPFAACTSVGPLHDRFRARGGVSAPAPAHSPCLTKTLGCAWAQGTVLSPSSWELPTARTRRHIPELPGPWRVGRGQALTPLPGETTLPACCSQVIVIKASGEVFVNQIYTQLPISAGEGRAPASPTSQRVPHLTPHGDPRPLCPQPTSHSSDPRPSSSSPRQTWACRWTSSWCPPCRCS